jgi:hypothetical protein
MSEAPAKKYCDQCAHCFVPPSGLRFARCLKTTTEISSDGFISAEFDKPVEHKYCSVVRSDDQLCGPSGQWFETKAVT